MVYTMSWTSLDQQNVVWFTFADLTAKQWECFQIYISNVYLGIANILESCYLEMKL